MTAVERRLRAAQTDFTTINGGGVLLFHSTADHTRINFLISSPFSQMDVRDHSVAKNTIIEGGGLLGAAHALNVDATSIAENVEFVKPGGKGAGLALENPLNFRGFIKGLAVGDFLQLGGTSTNIDVTSFELSKNQHELTITYNNNQHATYHLTDMQANTTFKLIQGTDAGGIHFSELTVVKTVGVADAQHDMAGLLV
jgi:hypothetical protein